MPKPMRIGIDVGSTTIKIVVLNEKDETVFSKYERHFSDVKNAIKMIFTEAHEMLGNITFTLEITGTGGIGLAELLDIPFIQEVIACTKTVEALIPETDVVIELGGEDAKITFFEGSLEQRMNGSCAGGTGAFIDQMADLLKTDAAGLNELSKGHHTIYPIASRCGVFAKTDVQPLINDGARKEDIAASVLQAVVNQTIAGLASGRKIKGKVAFLGGPLCFMSELRNRFIETLKLAPEDIIFPDNPQLFVAIGAALSSEGNETTSFPALFRQMNTKNNQALTPDVTLPPLFKDEAELTAFRSRHAQAQVSRSPLEDHIGVAFLGIDAGSTTTKVALINPEGELLYTYYGNNEGEPLQVTMGILEDLYAKMPKNSYIGKACVTGYGEALLKNALVVDLGEVETIAHYKAASRFQPDVDFILDIGGQDMKAMTMGNGILSSIQLNEACSSGCGSFLENFAKTLKYDIKDFAEIALEADHPVDLGSRCTVFMNSKVKQAQKEGATIADISAGLSISVIKNALYKVIKIKRPEDLGEKIVCQGGTFYNESVLRAFELISKREVIRPNIAGLMGAYGCALIAMESFEAGDVSAIIDADSIKDFTADKKQTHCTLCENNCLMTVTVFKDGRRFVTGNRCDKGAQITIEKHDAKINLVDYKYKRLFDYKPLKKKEASRGTIGIPRVLNLYENYPLWFTVFNELGFRVELSGRSSKKLYETGIGTIPSDTICYPAKMVHGHIQQLINKKVDVIFYPSVIFETVESKHADNHFNCPIVQSYPDVIRMNIDEIRSGAQDYRNPFLNLNDKDQVIAALTKTFSDGVISREEMADAVEKGFSELNAYKADMQQRGEEAIEQIVRNNEKGIVLAGRPYHSDPEINHSISEVITAYGFHVLTEDSISHLEDVDDLRVVNQWTYHSRLYAAARVVTKVKNLEMVQLNSFGCGIDAVTTDQVSEILKQYGKIHTVLKIDEGQNLGAIRIRIRSLKAAMAERDKEHFEPKKLYETPPQIIFTKEMRKNHTILVPMMSPIHQNGLIEVALSSLGYTIVQLNSSLQEEGQDDISEGLKFVNNDACYPAIITIGQMLKALESGKYDLQNTSVLLTQTGGGCRATNYIPLLRKALVDAGFPQIPVVSFSMGNKGVEQSPGFKVTPVMLQRLLIAVLYGDLFERVVYRTRPYEVVKGSADALHAQWLKQVRANVENGSFHLFNKNMKAIIRDFDTLPIRNEIRPRVGVVGEILVKYSATANNDLVRILEEEGAEAVVPDLIGFMNYSFYNQVYKTDELGFSKSSKRLAEAMIKAIEMCEKPMDKALRASERFDGISGIYELAEGAASILNIGNQTGEGWFLTGEMVELLKSGTNNIICMQPFGCLPNHIVGKGTLKELRSQYPTSNITTIDYDPGVSSVNQLNRIRLMLSTAKKNLPKSGEESRLEATRTDKLPELKNRFTPKGNQTYGNLAENKQLRNNRTN